MSNKLYKVKDTEYVKNKIKLLYATHAKYEHDWHSTIHFHPFTELFYVKNGKGIFQVGNESFEVEKNDLVIVNPNVNHTESSKDSNPLEYIVLGVEGIALNITRDTEDFKSLFSVINISNKNNLAIYFDAILQELKQENKYHTIISQNLLEVLIFNIARLKSNNIILANDNSLNKECDYIKKYIDINYSQDISLDSLANIAHMDKYYLTRIFKKNVGTSPIDYLLEKRISVAKILLETTQNNMSTITEITGFNSQSYFNQIFKKRVGLTPTQYRKKFLKANS